MIRLKATFVTGTRQFQITCLCHIFSHTGIYKAIDSHYTPGIYAEGYIAFALTFVRSFVRSCVPSFVRYFPSRSSNLPQSFWLKFLLVRISL